MLGTIQGWVREYREQNPRVVCGIAVGYSKVGRKSVGISVHAAVGGGIVSMGGGL